MKGRKKKNKSQKKVDSVYNIKDDGENFIIDQNDINILTLMQSDHSS